MKSQSYMTRALQARDPRYARVLGKLGYATKEAEAPTVAETPAPAPKKRTRKRRTKRAD